VRRVDDPAFAKAALPQIDRAVTWIIRASDEDRFNLVPASDPRDNEKVAGHLLGDQFWAVAGLESAARMAAARGDREREAAYAVERDVLRRRVREEIRELQQSLALTVIYVTHDQEEALAVSDRVIVMEGGRIAQQGTPHELYEAPASRFLADFIGDANLVDGDLAIDARGTTFSAGGVTAAVHANGAAAGPATLAVRPQRLRVVDAGQGALPGVCKRAAYLGSRMEYVVATAWGELLIFDAGAGKPRDRGAAVGVAFDPEAAIVLPRITSSG